MSNTEKAQAHRVTLILGYHCEETADGGGRAGKAQEGSAIGASADAGHPTGPSLQNLASLMLPAALHPPGA